MTIDRGTREMEKDARCFRVFVERWGMSYRLIRIVSAKRRLLVRPVAGQVVAPRRMIPHVLLSAD